MCNELGTEGVLEKTWKLPYKPCIKKNSNEAILFIGDETTPTISSLA